MKQHSSLLSQLFKAFGLIIGFYLLIFILFIALLGLFIVTVFYLFSINILLCFIVLLFLLVFMMALVPTLIAVVIPRRFKYKEPGVPVKPSDYPDLFKVISEVAKNMKQKIPQEVYFNFENNVGVNERGGILGFGSRRSIVIGITLLAYLNVSEFEAVLAHEFGHYSGGAAWLMGIVEKTRSHFEASINVIKENSGFLHFPFLWYRKVFLKTAQKMYRQREFYSDYISARFTGTKNTLDVLSKLDVSRATFGLYWTNEVLPIFNQRFRPPVIEGYKIYANSPVTKKEVDRYIKLVPKDNNTNKDDYHPELKARIGAIEKTNFPVKDENKRPALGLINYDGKLEFELLHTVPGLDVNIIGNMNPISWIEAEKTVWPKVLQEYISRQKNVFKNITPIMFPAFISNPESLTKLFPKSKIETKTTTQKAVGQSENRIETKEGLSFRAHKILERALLFVLFKSGWNVIYSLGKNMTALNNGIEICPDNVLEQLELKTLNENAWHDLCLKTGIADIRVWSENVMSAK